MWPILRYVTFTFFRTRVLSTPICLGYHYANRSGCHLVQVNIALSLYMYLYIHTKQSGFLSMICVHAHTHPYINQLCVYTEAHTQTHFDKTGWQMFVCWLLNVPATGECISGTDLLRQFYVLPHCDWSCRSNVLPHPVTLYWHRADQFQCWPYNARHLAG